MNKKTSNTVSTITGCIGFSATAALCILGAEEMNVATMWVLFGLLATGIVFGIIANITNK